VYEAPATAELEPLSEGQVSQLDEVRTYTLHKRNPVTDNVSVHSVF